MMGKNRINEDVTTFLNASGHPLRQEIEALREIVLSSEHELTEGIKWNGPNYRHGTEDRVTMRIQPPKQVQLIFHRGAKVKEQPEERLLKREYSFLTWKENDRAIATFTGMDDIKKNADAIVEIVDLWIEATKEKAD